VKILSHLQFFMMLSLRILSPGKKYMMLSLRIILSVHAAEAFVYGRLDEQPAAYRGGPVRPAQQVQNR
jgi:hypothetical protein